MSDWELGAAAVIVSFLLVGLFFYWAFKRLFGGRGKVSYSGSMICPACGTQGEPATATKGSFIIEIILWLCFIIPGLIYTVWRISSRHPICPVCKAAGMIQVDTPRGAQLVAQFAAKTQAPA